ncbi:MAG: hypothetical protein CEN87_186 [Parcubacteria group bacterium Licking1014_1]|nr:MAG: hypothetical protein CEN87_186 [Parcubacteria group bacterium Licking1014_1]
MEDIFVNPVRDQGVSGEQQKRQTSLEVNKPLSGQISNGVKITSAVYKLLEFFPESEPLKNRAKEKALSIMENKDKASNQILKDIDLLLSYLKIGQNQGWLSPINYFIISNEYEKIKKEINPVGNKSLEAVDEQSISERQEKILEFLKENEKAQVMDLKSVLTNVTKRTIRRDLDELLKIGKITRMGEWNQVFYKLGGQTPQ